VSEACYIFRSPRRAAQGGEGIVLLVMARKTGGHQQPVDEKVAKKIEAGDGSVKSRHHPL
jgi:hypothetical protein